MVLKLYNNRKVERERGDFKKKFALFYVLIPWVSEVILRLSSEQLFNNGSTSTDAIPSYPKLYLSCEISSGLLIILPQDSNMD